MSPRRLLVEELHQLQKLLVEPLAENEEDGVVLDGISWGSLDEEERPHPSTHMKTCSSKEDTAIFPPIFFTNLFDQNAAKTSGYCNHFGEFFQIVNSWSSNFIFKI